ncbi:TRPL translocation defect protein 14-like [Oppia nitens]|uniref:TRPL translocation defect protein 14-like n=1 Tax=Oppia nitens TaxID=1686743 RepID=UPI0023DA28BA|nr:TRPL translocation defect protein 14-like [Oppia nitens]
MMSADNDRGKERVVYRLALTGGPCSGKTTGQARLCTFFENIGWKVYRVPETATTLFSGGVRFPDLSKEAADKFQENLIKVMIATETTFFDLAQSDKRNVLVVCDRGIMDAAAYMAKDVFDSVLKSNGWNAVELRDNRYNQVIHLMTSANGAEAYYNIEDNPCRTEGIEQARQLDKATIEAWVGHPYIDVIDNSTDFDTKLTRMIANVCKRIGIDAGDRLAPTSRKFKFLVASMPPDSMFPSFQDFEVVHDYLTSPNPKIQSRLRKRGQNGNWSYQYTVRRGDAGDQMVELRRQISHRDYVNILAQRDDSHLTVYKTRRCFVWEDTYFQLDIYRNPCNERCEGLILLETYQTLKNNDTTAKVPPFLKIIKEVTKDSSYSMYNLSSKSEWKKSSKIINGLNS